MLRLQHPPKLSVDSLRYRDASESNECEFFEFGSVLHWRRHVYFNDFNEASTRSIQSGVEVQHIKLRHGLDARCVQQRDSLFCIYYLRIFNYNSWRLHVL